MVNKFLKKNSPTSLFCRIHDILFFTTELAGVFLIDKLDHQELGETV